MSHRIHDPKPCKCGCGEPVRDGNTYVHGHNSRGVVLGPTGKKSWNNGQRKINAQDAKKAYKKFGRVDLAASDLGVNMKTLRKRLREIGVTIKRGFRGKHTEETKLKIARSFAAGYVKEKHHKWLGDKLNRNCKQCGKQFRVITMNSTRRFCSRECAVKAKTGSGHPNWQGGITFVEVKCAECGKTVTRQRTSTAKNFYCGRECADKAQTGARSVRWRGGILEPRACSICGKVVQRSKYCKTEMTVCSRECLSISMTKRDPLSRRARYEKSRSKDFTKDLRSRVKTRDNYTCQLCDATQGELSSYLAVHHIDGDGHHNNLENLITLCCPCHAWAGHHKDVSIPLLTGMIRQEEYANVG